MTNLDNYPARRAFQPLRRHPEIYCWYAIGSVSWNTRHNHCWLLIAIWPLLSWRLQYMADAAVHVMPRQQLVVLCVFIEMSRNTLCILDCSVVDEYVTAA